MATGVWQETEKKCLELMYNMPLCAAKFWSFEVSLYFISCNKILHLLGLHLVCHSEIHHIASYITNNATAW